MHQILKHHILPLFGPRDPMLIVNVRMPWLKLLGAFTLYVVWLASARETLTFINLFRLKLSLGDIIYEVYLVGTPKPKVQKQIYFIHKT